MNEKDIKSMLRDMDIEELQGVRAETDKLLRAKAMKALEDHQTQENELRVLAGLKRRPIGPTKAASAKK